MTSAFVGRCGTSCRDAVGRRRSAASDRQRGSSNVDTLEQRLPDTAPCWSGALRDERAVRLRSRPARGRPARAASGRAHPRPRLRRRCLTQQLAAMGVHVIGVDSSPQMIAAASARDSMRESSTVSSCRSSAASMPCSATRRCTGCATPTASLRESFAPATRRTFRRRVRCGGNVATLVQALETGLARRGIDPASGNPWHFASVAEHRARLENCGFRVQHLPRSPDPRACPATSSSGSNVRVLLHAAIAGSGASAFHRRGRRCLSSRLDRRGWRLRGGLRTAAICGQQAGGCGGGLADG